MLELFRLNQMTAGHLNRPLVGRTKPHTTGHRIGPGKIEVPSILIGLAPVEDRPLDGPSLSCQPARHHAERHVRGVEGVMAERREHDRRRRCSMHERDRTKGRFTDRSYGHAQRRQIRKRLPVRR